MQPTLIFIIGCTGVGKGAAARELARRTGGEILSVDSMKVYRRMDIGTAKPSSENRREVPHHLIDVAEPSEPFSVAQFVAAADRVIGEITARGRPVLAVGGTALYIKALTKGLFEGPGTDGVVRARLRDVARQQGVEALYGRLRQVDPVAAGRIHPNDIRRIVRALEVYELSGEPISDLQAQWNRQELRYSCTFLGLRRERTDQNHRMNLRVKRMIDAGFVSEVESLLAEPEPLSTTARQALGYADIIRHLGGKISLADAVESIKINTRRFAKAQRTWFKRFIETEWLDVSAADTPESLADELIRRRGALWKT